MISFSAPFPSTNCLNAVFVEVPYSPRLNIQFHLTKLSVSDSLIIIYSKVTDSEEYTKDAIVRHDLDDIPHLWKVKLQCCVVWVPVIVVLEFCLNYGANI